MKSDILIRYTLFEISINWISYLKYIFEAYRVNIVRPRIYEKLLTIL